MAEDDGGKVTDFQKMILVFGEECYDECVEEVDEEIEGFKNVLIQNHKDLALAKLVLEDTQERLKAAESKLKSTQDRLKAAESMLAHARGQYYVLNEQNAELKAENAEFKAENAKLKGDLAAYEKTIGNVAGLYRRRTFSFF